MRQASITDYLRPAQAPAHIDLPPPPQRQPPRQEAASRSQPQDELHNSATHNVCTTYSIQPRPPSSKHYNCSHTTTHSHRNHTGGLTNSLHIPTNLISHPQRRHRFPPRNLPPVQTTSTTPLTKQFMQIPPCLMTCTNQTVTPPFSPR